MATMTPAAAAIGSMVAAVSSSSGRGLVPSVGLHPKVGLHPGSGSTVAAIASSGSMTPA